MATTQGITSVTPGIRKVVQQVTDTKTQGVPPEFSSPFEWAAHWVKLKGVTLPPDTNEFRTLRNWFCYKFDQFKKGALGQKNIDLLEKHGIDFGLYEALNTGKGEREADGPHIGLLRAWHAIHGTYDLDMTADAKLLGWQAKLVTSFTSGGASSRMRGIVEKLPGLCLGLWRRPTDKPWSADIKTWWEQAASFERAAKTHPPFRGSIHPEMPKEFTDWGRTQIACWVAGSITARRRGWMRGIGLVANMDRIRVEAKRAMIAVEARGGEDKIESYRKRDYRIDHLLGAFMSFRMLARNANDRELCTSFSLTPAQAIKLRSITKGLADHRPGAIRKHVTTARMIFLADKKAFTPSYWDWVAVDPENHRPIDLTEKVEFFGRLAYEVVTNFKAKTARPAKRSRKQTEKIADLSGYSRI